MLGMGTEKTKGSAVKVVIWRGVKKKKGKFSTRVGARTGKGKKGQRRRGVKEREKGGGGGGERGGGGVSKEEPEKHAEADPQKGGPTD